jgi:hypothetical protein
VPGGNKSAVVMPALGAGIHVFLPFFKSKTWMAGTSPAMTPESDSDDAQKSLPSFATAGFCVCGKIPPTY